MLHDRELTLSATAFKAQCLQLMTQLAARKLTRVVVTKRGKPIAVMGPPEPMEVAQPDPSEGLDAPYPAWWGCMRHDPLLPDDFDWGSWRMPEPDVDELLKQIGGRNPFA